MRTNSYILAVQGEGRGHLMQALVVYEVLTSAGHEVCCIVVGIPSGRVLPDYFRQRVAVPVVSLPSPGFVKRAGRAISLRLSLWRALWRFPEIVSGLRRFHRLVCFHRPDAVVNFYEPLAGLHGLLHPRMVRRVSIAHQYVYLHEGFDIPGAGGWQRWLLRAFTRLTAAGSERMLALSIGEMTASRDVRLRVVPPILRRELLALPPSDEGFLLVYLVNAGYMPDVHRWHAANPGVRVRCFTDDPDVRDLHGGLYRPAEGLSFHALDDRLFLGMLATCRAVVTSAGFETVCEALLLGKPILMVPVEGHQEQLCNALDAVRQGLAGMSRGYAAMGRVFSIPPLPVGFRDAFHRRVCAMYGILLEETGGGAGCGDAKVVEISVRAGSLPMQAMGKAMPLAGRR
jgi:uncharacterized protein (TIGR00661 family)